MKKCAVSLLICSMLVCSAFSLTGNAQSTANVSNTYKADFSQPSYITDLSNSDGVLKLKGETTEGKVRYYGDYYEDGVFSGKTMKADTAFSEIKVDIDKTVDSPKTRVILE
jgi:hypothetical protein